MHSKQKGAAVAIPVLYTPTIAPHPSKRVDEPLVPATGRGEIVANLVVILAVSVGIWLLFRYHCHL